MHKFVISTADCVMADRRLVSIQQQSEMQKCTVVEGSISASPITVFQKREQFRLEALKRCEEELRHTTAIQLCYDGKIVNKMGRWGRYVFLVKFFSEEKDCGKVIAVKIFLKATSVTSESIFTVATEEVCESAVNKVYSIMSDTTALNTGKKSDINKRLVDFYRHHYVREVHSLEYLFLIN